MGYTEKSHKNFSRRLFAFEARKRVNEGVRNDCIVHVASVIQFLVFCKTLSSERRRYFFNKTNLEMTSSIGLRRGLRRSDQARR